MPRSTAEGAASLRAAGALERDSAVRCPDDMAAGFLGGFTATTLAKCRLTRPLYLRRANQILPGAYPFAIARCRFIDEVTLSEVNAGLDEVVLLGAGLDSRPYRFADRLEGLPVFEVDHPASQATKRARLRRAYWATSRAGSASCPSTSPVTSSRRRWRGRARRAGRDALHLERCLRVSAGGRGHGGAFLDRRSRLAEDVDRLRRDLGERPRWRKRPLRRPRAARDG